MRGRGGLQNRNPKNLFEGVLGFYEIWDLEPFIYRLYILLLLSKNQPSLA
jgi:hypothetical protein